MGLSTPEQVGNYNAANNFARSLILVASLVSIFLGPVFAQIRIIQPETLPRLFDAANHPYLFLLGLICTLVFGLSAPLVVLVFGLDQLGAVPILRFQVIGSLVVASSQLYSSILDHFGQARSRSIVLLATTVLYLVFNTILIPALDGVGAALAILLSFFPYSLYVLIHAGAQCDAHRGIALFSMGLTMAGVLAAALAATQLPSSNAALAGIVVSLGVYLLLTIPIQLLRMRRSAVRV